MYLSGFYVARRLLWSLKTELLQTISCIFFLIRIIIILFFTYYRTIPTDQVDYRK